MVCWLNQYQLSRFHGNHFFENCKATKLQVYQTTALNILKINRPHQYSNYFVDYNS